MGTKLRREKRRSKNEPVEEVRSTALEDAMKNDLLRTILSFSNTRVTLILVNRSADGWQS